MHGRSFSFLAVPTFVMTIVSIFYSYDAYSLNDMMQHVYFYSPRCIILFHTNDILIIIALLTSLIIRAIICYNIDTSRYIIILLHQSMNTHTVLHPLIHKYQTQQSYKQATDPNRVAVLSPDMRRVRAKQQEAAHQRALRAEKERKEKVKVERERKRVKSPEEERWDMLGGEGKGLGVGGDDDGAGLRQRR